MWGQLGWQAVGMRGATDAWGPAPVEPRGPINARADEQGSDVLGHRGTMGAPRTEEMLLILIGLHGRKFGAPPIIGGSVLQGAPRGHLLHGKTLQNQGGAGAPRTSSVWCPPEV